MSVTGPCRERDELSTGPCLRDVSRSVVEQPQLENPGRVESVDPQHRPGRGCRGGGGHEPDELAAGHLAPRARPPPDRRWRRSRAAPLPPSPRRSCSPGRAPRSAAPARARARPGSRRRAPAPQPRLPRRVERAAQVDVEGDQRRSRADQDGARTSSSRVGPKSGASSPARRSAAAAPLAPPRAEEGRPAPTGELAVEEDRQPELAADALGQRERRFARPLHVLRPQRHDRHDVGHADARMRALVQPQVDPLTRARRSPASSASTTSSSDPTSVKTERLWSASACTSSTRALRRERLASASIVARSRPSEKFGTDSSGRVTRVV